MQELRNHKEIVFSWNDKPEVQRACSVLYISLIEASRVN